MKTLTISAYKLETFKKEFQKLVNLSEKMGLPIPTYKVGIERQTTRKVHIKFEGMVNTSEYIIDVIDIQIDIEETYKFNGWSLVGTVFFRENAVILNDVNAVFPNNLGINYHICDHCNGINYNRDKSFIVKNEDTFKQVGSSCVKKFLGYSPKNILDLQEQLNIVDKISSMDDFERSSYGVHTRKLEGLVAFDSSIALDYCYYQVIKDGRFIKKEYSGNSYPDLVQINKETATMSVISSLISEKVVVPTIPSNYKEELVNYIDSLEFVTEPTYNDKNEISGYHIDNENIINKIKSLISSEKVRRMDIFIFAIAVNMFEKSKVVHSSKHIGIVGEKININATIEDIKTGSGYYGSWILYSLIDSEGNIFTKFGNIGEEYTIDGSVSIGSVINAIAVVKEHSTFNKNQITVLGRFSKIKTSKIKMSKINN